MNQTILIDSDCLTSSLVGNLAGGLPESRPEPRLESLRSGTKDLRMQQQHVVSALAESDDHIAAFKLQGREREAESQVGEGSGKEVGRGHGFVRK